MVVVAADSTRKKRAEKPVEPAQVILGVAIIPGDFNGAIEGKLSDFLKCSAAQADLLVRKAIASRDATAAAKEEQRQALIDLLLPILGDPKPNKHLCRWPRARDWWCRPTSGATAIKFRLSGRNFLPIRKVVPQ